MSTEAKAVAIVSLLTFIVCLVFILISISKKKRNEALDPHDLHEEGHVEDHHHGNPVASFIKELLKPWYIWIPLAIIFVYWIGSPVTWRKFMHEEVAPAPNYMQFDVKAQVAGTDQISFYKVHAFGPDYCRFDSVFNTGMFFDWNPMTGDGTCGYYGGGTGKLKVKSISKPTPLSFVIIAERQKQENLEEWELMTIEGKSSL